jgi:hypothetical protein
LASNRKNDKFLELITEHSGDFLENSNHYMYLIITLTMTMALTKSSDYRVAEHENGVFDVDSTENIECRESLHYFLKYFQLPTEAISFLIWIIIICRGTSDKLLFSK